MNHHNIFTIHVTVQIHSYLPFMLKYINTNQEMLCNASNMRIECKL